MKSFYANQRYFLLTSYRIEAVPITDPSLDSNITSKLNIAKTLCHDACYLSSNGEGQISVELMRCAEAKQGGRIDHLITVRSYGQLEKDCQVRHTAYTNGLTSVLRRFGYRITECSFDDLSAINRNLNYDTVWGLTKTPATEYGQKSEYMYIPMVNHVDWESIYSALDGSGCSLIIQMIPSKVSEIEQKFIIKNLNQCLQTADGWGTSIKDTLAAKIANHWQMLADTVSEPVADINIVVTGNATNTALVTARLQQALEKGPFCLTRLSKFAKYTAFASPWEICEELKKNQTFLFSRWTSGEVMQIFALPKQSDHFVGVRANPFSILPEKELLPIALTKYESSKIFIGNSVISDQSIFMSLEDFVLHMGIFGKSGVGKTTLLKLMIQRLVQKNISVLILEPVKKEYRSLIHTFEKSKVFTVESDVVPLQINPFRVPEGITLGDYRSSLVSAFKAAISMPDPLPSLFEAAITEAYLQYGWTDSSKNNSPTVQNFDLAQFIQVFQRVIKTSTYSSEVKGNLMAGGAFRLKSLIERCPKTFDTYNSTNIKDILNGKVVIEMGKLEPEQKSLVSALTLINILAYLKATRISGTPLQNIILIDEAHALLDQGGGSTIEEKTLNSTMNQLLVNLVTEMRAYGVGVIFSDQSPSRIGSKMLDNVDTLISFRLSGAEASTLQRHMGADKRYEQCLPLLDVGEVVITNRHLRTPLAIKIPLDSSNELCSEVTDEVIASIHADYLQSHAKEYRPYKECVLANCEMCSFSIRGEAQKYSMQVFLSRRQEIKDINSVAAHAVKIPEYLRSICHSCDDTLHKKLCRCTVVHFIRKCSAENVPVSSNAVPALFQVIDKELSMKKE